MSELMRLSALNPVPEIGGNPGPARPSRRTWLRAQKQRLLLAGLVAVLIVGGSAVVRSQTSPRTDVGFASPADPRIVTLSPPDSSVVLDSAAPVRPHLLAGLTIPAIDVQVNVVDGLSATALRFGPGRYGDGAIPGQRGNAALAGHRAAYGAPFQRLDELSVGDEIFVSTGQGLSEYRVVGSRTVASDDATILGDFGDNRLTLTTSDVESDQERLVVTANLVSAPAATIDLAPLPRAASLAVIPRESAPDIGESAMNVAGRYLSFSGNVDPLATARSFILTQFPDWSGDLDFVVHEQTWQSASVRWADRTHNTGGWIVLHFVRGRFWVVEMTVDGVLADLNGAPSLAQGSVTSELSVVAQVHAPIPAWMLPGHGIAPLRTSGRRVLDQVEIDERAHGRPVPLQVQNIDDDFQEVRIVVRDPDGVQIGGLASSLVAAAP